MIHEHCCVNGVRGWAFADLFDDETPLYIYSAVLVILWSQWDLASKAASHIDSDWSVLSCFLQFCYSVFPVLLLAATK